MFTNCYRKNVSFQILNQSVRYLCLYAFNTCPCLLRLTAVYMFLYVCLFFSSIRVFARTMAHFSRVTEDGVQHIDGHFTSHPQQVSRGHDFNCEHLQRELELAVENFNTRGSGFVLDAVASFTLVITQFSPLIGLSCIPTPTSIAKKESSDYCQKPRSALLRIRHLVLLTPTKKQRHFRLQLHQIPEYVEL